MKVWELTLNCDLCPNVFKRLITHCEKRAEAADRIMVAARRSGWKVERDSGIQPKSVTCKSCTKKGASK